MEETGHDAAPYDSKERLVTTQRMERFQLAR